MRTRALLGLTAAPAVVAALLVAGPVDDAGAAATRPSQTGALQQYVVLYEPGASDAAARAAVTSAGGVVLTSAPGVGYAVAESRRPDFALRAERSPLLVGAARNRSIGRAPTTARPDRSAVERLDAERAAAPSADVGAAEAAAVPDAEPLAARQWDMRQIDATPSGSYAVQRGSRGVMVGIIDTGIDAGHPDIAPNLDVALSRNFTRDMPDIDNGEDADGDGIGDEPCEVPSCVDPATRDDDGHGTHVASTVAAPINALGIAGVAPDVTLVNIRAGQDSGYFFLQPVLDALVYAGNIGVDVVNMSFYVDPWLYNCNHLPGDSEAEQAEQRTIRQAVQRALDYARSKGVLPVAAEGNGATDLGHPTEDLTSPDYPIGSERPRAVDNTCITVPTESRGVVSVTSTGISWRKAYYSDYGIEQADVSAPGGDAYDTPDQRPDLARAVLGAYPAELARKNGDIDAQGFPTSPFIRRSCVGTTCGYYQYLQGTSMASPHAAGVAALIVSRYGTADTAAGHTGLTLAPAVTEGILLGTARDRACPAGGVQDYRRVTASGVRLTTHSCEGTPGRNGFYGDGVVSALRAVS